MQNDLIIPHDRLKHYTLSLPISAHNIINDMYEVEVRISAKVLDMAEDAIVQAVIEEARSAGITDLYLMDKKFVLDALVEKMKRERGLCE